MSEKCECGFGYGENEYPDECDNCGEYFCPKCMKKHKKVCKDNDTNEDSFNLSEKIRTDRMIGVANTFRYIRIEDVREFIKRLKDNSIKEYPRNKFPFAFFDIIDALAGDDLND